jgi:hypothetical protein
MEIRKGILDRASGERAIAIFPPLVPDGQTSWHRRLNLYTGRSLSALALETEQNGRAGRLTTRAQLASPGVVGGLEIEIEQEQPGLEHAFLHVAPGYGLSASGEDVLLASARRIPLGALAVTGRTLANATPTLANLLARGELASTPPAAIVLLRPVILKTQGEFDPHDPCDDEEANDAFEDVQLADATMFELFPWPADSLPLPPAPASMTSAAINRWRNEIAYAVFEREALTLPPNQLAWEALGVPIGVIGFDPAWSPVFADRYAVTRAGGKPIRRSRLQPESGTPFLWQARMEQLAEQLSQPGLARVAAREIGAMLRFLPPAGVLPRDAVDLADAATLNQFFPASFGVDAVPIPIEQLDLALEAGAALAPFDLETPDVVRVLVPVPGHLYQPRLLQSEVIDGLFAATIDRFKTHRNQLLARRANVRGQAAALAKALDGRAPEYPPDATAADETPATEPLDPDEARYGTSGAGADVTVDRFVALEGELKPLLGDTYVSSDAATGLNLKRDGLREYIKRLKAQIDRADDQINVGFLRVQTDMYRVRQLVLGTDVAAKLVTSSALAGIVKDETSSYTTREALSAYVKSFKSQPDVNPLLASNVAAAATADTPAGFQFVPSDLAVLVDRIQLPDSGIKVTRPVTSSTDLRLASRDFDVVLPQDSRVDEVVNQQPLPGAMPYFGETTIGQRLQQSSTQTAKDNTRATHVEVLNALVENSLFDDLDVPYIDKYEPTKVTRATSKLKDLQRDSQKKILEVNLPGDDEIANFNAGIDSIDVVVGTLRAGEARVKRFRDGLQKAEDARQQIEGFAAAAARRLNEIGDSLAEARHDVAVAEALRDEEQDRLDAINARREQILRDEVKFLAYLRPRSTATLLDTPMRALDPGFTPAAVPACLRNPQTVPAELRAMVDLFRDVPIRWLVQMPRLLEKIDRVELLQELMQSGIVRATTPARTREVLFQNSSFSSPLGQAIARTYVAQQQVAGSYRAALAQFDGGLLKGRSWKQVRDVVSDTASLDDMIAAGHGNSEVAQRAIKELDDIGQVAACLHEAFAAVKPALRLRWAEILSQYDDPVNLRNLASLSGWGEIEVLDRRAMQQLVDWLHGAIDAGVPQAVAMINDLVRICVLLASHAPVNQLLTARIAQAAPVLPGGTLTLNVDVTRVKIGMQVLLYDKVDKNKVIAQAVIDDMNEQVAAARVTYAAHAGIQVERDAQVVVTPAQELQRFGKMAVGR